MRTAFNLSSLRPATAQRIRQHFADSAQLKLDAVDALAPAAAGAAQISTATSPVSAWRIPTNEELIIAEHTCEVLNLR